MAFFKSVQVHDNEIANSKDFNNGFADSVTNISKLIQALGISNSDFILGGKITATGLNLSISPIVAYSTSNGCFISSETLSITVESNTITRTAILQAGLSKNNTDPESRKVVNHSDSTVSTQTLNTKKEYELEFSIAYANGMTAPSKTTGCVKIAEIVIPGNSSTVTIKECTREFRDEENDWTNEKSATMKLNNFIEGFEAISQIKKMIPESYDESLVFNESQKKLSLNFGMMSQNNTTKAVAGNVIFNTVNGLIGSLETALGKQITNLGTEIDEVDSKITDSIELTSYTASGSVITNYCLEFKLIKDGTDTLKIQWGQGVADQTMYDAYLAKEFRDGNYIVTTSCFYTEDVDPGQPYIRNKNQNMIRFKKGTATGCITWIAIGF